MESSEEQVADAIRQDAYKLQDENVFTKLNQVIKLKQPSVIYDRLRKSFRGLLIIFGAGMSEPPELLNEFVAEYDALVELWSWASDTLGYDIHKSSWTTTFACDTPHETVRSHIQKHIGNAAE